MSGTIGGSSDRGQPSAGLVVFATTSGQAEQGPVGDAVACAGEAFGIDKGLQPKKRMLVQTLPVFGDGSGDTPEQMGREMRNLYPGQDKKSGVVCQQVAVTLPALGRPAQVRITTVDSIGRRGKSETGHHATGGIGQIFQVFAHGLSISQVMVLPDQTVEQLLLGLSPDLSWFDGAKIA